MTSVVAGRRMRGELRRFLHPVVIGTVVAVAVAACTAQHQRGGADIHPPSPVDVAGSVRIALQHHATALGFLLAGVGAGWTSGEDARSGAAGIALLADRRVLRLWCRRVGALLVLSAASVLVTSAALRLSSGVTACTRGCAPSSRSSGGSLAADAATATLVCMFAAALATAVALTLRSELLAAVVTVAVFLVPANHVGHAASWVTPAKWVAQAMRFEPYGSGSDYTGGKAAWDTDGRLASVALAILVTATVGLAWAGRVLLERRGGQGERASG